MKAALRGVNFTSKASAHGAGEPAPNAKRLAMFVCALLLLLLGACHDTPTIAPLDRQAVVLAFGDSLTAGNGAGEAESYPTRLQELIGRTVINAGVPGELSSQGRARLPALLEQHRPALLILCHGGNDLLQRGSEQDAAENLRAMVGTARERGIDVILIGVPKPGLLLEMPEFYEEIAGEFEIPYDADILADILADRTLKSDHVHPNAEGYRRLAEAIAALLQEAAAL